MSSTCCCRASSNIGLRIFSSKVALKSVAGNICTTYHQLKFRADNAFTQTGPFTAFKRVLREQASGGHKIFFHSVRFAPSRDALLSPNVFIRCASRFLVNRCVNRPASLAKLHPGPGPGWAGGATLMITSLVSPSGTALIETGKHESRPKRGEQLLNQHNRIARPSQFPWTRGSASQRILLALDSKGGRNTRNYPRSAFR
eukprot:g8895.t1